MPFSIAWGLLLLADLCYRVPGSMHASKHTHEIRKDPPNPSTASKLANFSLNLYHSLARQSNTSNIVLSPVSIAIAFAMLSLGTKGDAHIQILHGLDVHFKKVPKADVHKAFHHLFNILNQSDNQYQLATNSAVFIDKNLKQIHNFLETVKNMYHAEAFPINFEDTEEAKKQINDYVEKGTQGKIVDLVKELDKDTFFVLVNYIFFKDSWKDGFEANHLVEGDFHVDEKTTIRVPMATCLGVSDLHRDKELSCWMLLKGYQGRARVFLLLPDPGNVPQLEESLSEEYLSNILRDIDIWSASLHLPKLSISGTYDLKTLLSKLGITKVFSNEADLSGITEEAPLKLSKVIHKAVLRIQENGTGHSGATLLEESTWSRPLTIKFNRPFLIIIKDENTNIPLFVGKMVNPMHK